MSVYVILRNDVCMLVVVRSGNSGSVLIVGWLVVSYAVRGGQGGCLSGYWPIVTPSYSINYKKCI